MGPQPSCRPDDAPRSIDRSVQYCSRRVLRKPAHPTMERCKDRHCRRGAAALLFGLRRPGAVSPRVILAPEDLARPVQPAGFFFATKPDSGRTDGGRRGSRRGYRATSLWGHPNENPGTKRSTVKPRRRRDSGKLAGESIQAEGYPMAGTAAERISESARGTPAAEREQSGLKKGSMDSARERRWPFPQWRLGSGPNSLPIQSNIRNFPTPNIASSTAPSLVCSDSI
jgi:hypothetical protein